MPWDIRGKRAGAYRKRKQYTERAKNAPAPLDDTQLNLLLRHAFAWLSAAGLFGLMTLLGWRTRLDFGRGCSFRLMARLGLALAFLLNQLAAAALWNYAFSFFAVLLFCALAFNHHKRTAVLASAPELRIQPTDSLRFSILLALELYLGACREFLAAVYSRFGGLLGGEAFDIRYSHRQMPGMPADTL